MKIGIIGAGQIGSALIRQYTTAGHTVKMTNSSGIEKLKDLAVETGASAVSMVEVIKDVDVIVITIPMISLLTLPKHLLSNVSTDTSIIDTGNYYPIRDGIIEEIENGMVESIWVSNQLQRAVVKAYNSILAGSLVESGLPKDSPSRIALPISGDDKKSKEIASTLINDSGFDSLDIGNLQESWRQQPGSPAYCTDLTLPQLKKNIAKAKKELLPERREMALRFIIEQNQQSWIDTVNNNRKVYQTDLED
jgi:8-hydroxy-5-deazaflavin:NADPH oxidoreductase